MIYDDYTLASLVTLIGRAPDFSSRGDDGKVWADWHLGDGRVVAFTFWDGDNWVEVHQKKPPASSDTEG